MQKVLFRADLFVAFAIRRSYFRIRLFYKQRILGPRQQKRQQSQS